MTYSLDLKKCVIHYYKNFNVSIRDISKQLSIPKSSIHRWINDSNKKKNINQIDTKINFKKENILNILRFLKNSIQQNPYQTLEILKDKIHKKFAISICPKTISNYLHYLNYNKKRTIQKLYSKTLKEHILNKRQFKRKIKKINKKDIICIDETYINGTIYNKYGWCLKNKKLESYIRRKALPKKYSIIMAITINGVIKMSRYKQKGINKELFYIFIKDLLKNIKNKYILMDNVNFHKCNTIINIIKETKNIPLFIPPYSPEFNPIEEVFSKMKYHIRKNINIHNFNKTINILLEKFIKNVTSLENYYKHAFG